MPVRASLIMAPILVALRTDGSFDAVKTFLDRKNAGGFAVREVADQNEHWHWLIEIETKNVQSFRTMLKRAVPELAGNGMYSATEIKDLAKYERYLSKGASEGVGPEVAWRSSIKYTDEKIEELHQAYWTENRQLKKRKLGSMIDWVTDEAKRQNVHHNDRKQLAKIYIRELQQRGKPVNCFSLRANLNTIQLNLCPDDTLLDALADHVTQF